MRYITQTIKGAGRVSLMRRRGGALRKRERISVEQRRTGEDGKLNSRQDGNLKVAAT
jgi:hypothetical protein